MSHRVNALILVMLMAIAPLVPLASADASIGLSTDVNHVILSPGETTNITLTVDNNGSSIESYSISVSGYDSVWEIIPSDTNINNVIPTFSASTTIAVRLSTTALPSDSGTLTITVTEPDNNISSQIDVLLSVQPQYLPAIDASMVGDNGLVSMAPGDDLNLTVMVTNNGNVNDTILLSVDQSPDLVGFWANWSSGASNNSGNNTSGNNTGGNNTGGNNTGGNNTGGNNTGGNLSQVWSTPVTLDNSTNNVGEQSSLAIDSNNHLHVTYLDYTSFNLEYVTYDGSSWSTPVSLDSTDNVGWQSSLAIDSNDNLHVTYYDLTYDNLEYMTYDGSSWSTPVSIDSTGDVGAMSSLAIDSNDHLHVTYLDNANGNLEYMTHDGSSWSTPVTLDNGINVGYDSSLAIDSNDKLHVTYQDEVYDNLEYVTYDGSSWSSPVTLDSTDDLGYHSSLAIDSNDNLHVTYLDYTNYNLEYMTYDGSSWSTPVSLDSTDDVGWQSSLAIDSNDNLHVTYLDNTNDNLEYMTHDGSSWSTPVSLDSTDDVGSDSSLAIDSNDNLHVTYYDYTNENLEYMFSSNSAGGNNTGGNSTGNSTNGIQRSAPQGWEVRFLDDSMDIMNPSEQRNAVLRISIPTDEDPGYYGFDLFAASVYGNFSVSTTIIVNITATHNLSFAHNAGQMLLPGENTTSTVDITSLSTSDGNWTWQTMVDSGDCSAQLMEYQTMIMADSNYELDILITAGVNTHVNDECHISLHGQLDSDTSISENYEFTVSVGEMWGLSMVLPTSIKLDVDQIETFNVVVNNDGTEEDTISLIGIDDEGVTFTNPAPVTLDRGSSVYVVMEVLIESSLVGNITLDFTISSTNSGTGSVNDSGIFEVKEFAELSMTGPSDNRMVIIPGQNSSITLNISNDGTKDLDLSASISGLPNGISVVKGLENVMLTAGESTDVELELMASSGMQPSSNLFTIAFDGGWDSTDLTIELQITDRNEVLIDSSGDSIIASPLGDSNLTIMVTNLGTSSGTFVADINNSMVSDWFTISVDKLSLTLESGESGSITISAREVATGASLTGEDLTVTVTSTADSSVSDMMTIAIIPQVADGMITVLSDNDEAQPGQTIHGNVIVTNLGTATDTMRINTVEMDCNLDDVVVELSPSMSSSPIPWSCTIGDEENAGTKALTFRLTSAARSNMVVTASESYTVEPIWRDEVISFTLDQNDLKFDESNEQQTVSLTICNTANTYVEGQLELVGKNEPQMDGVFYRAGETGINSTYSLSSNGCQDFRLMLTPLNLDGFEAVIIIHSVSQVEGQTVRDESPELRADVAGPHMPPDGMNLGLLELTNKNSIILLSTGWVLSILLLAYIRLFRKTVEAEEEEEEEEIPLGPNEVRIDEYNKVTCCSCEARLGVPEGSEPPFRFTCPKCDTRIRVVE